MGIPVLFQIFLLNILYWLIENLCMFRLCFQMISLLAYIAAFFMVTLYKLFLSLMQLDISIICFVIYQFDHDLTTLPQVKMCLLYYLLNSYIFYTSKIIFNFLIYNKFLWMVSRQYKIIFSFKFSRTNCSSTICHIIHFFINDLQFQYWCVCYVLWYFVLLLLLSIPDSIFRSTAFQYRK